MALPCQVLILPVVQIRPQHSLARWPVAAGLCTPTLGTLNCFLHDKFHMIAMGTATPAPGDMGGYLANCCQQFKWPLAYLSSFRLPTPPTTLSREASIVQLL